MLVIATFFKLNLSHLTNAISFDFPILSGFWRSTLGDRDDLTIEVQIKYLIGLQNLCPSLKPRSWIFVSPRGIAFPLGFAIAIGLFGLVVKKNLLGRIRQINSGIKQRRF